MPMAAKQAASLLFICHYAIFAGWPGAPDGP